MRVTIEHKERKEGLLRRRTIYEVHLTVEFSPEEQAVLNRTDIGELLILKRALPLLVRGKLDPDDDRKLIRKFDLTPNSLMRGTDRYDFESPGEAKHYDQQLREQLIKLKQLIDANTTAPSGATTFEL